MKTRTYLTALLGMAAIAACSESEVFYSISYPVVRVEAAVSAESIVTPPETEGGEPTVTENPIIVVVSGDVMTHAPMHPGGGYDLDFTKFNGGPLRADTQTDEGIVKGSFVKTPGADSLQFIYGGHNYVCKVDSYKDEDNIDKIVLVEDLTAHYQKLYPDNKITQVLRKEFTTTNSK